MNSPANTSRFLLLPETTTEGRNENRPRVRRYRLTRVGVSSVPSGRMTGYEHLRRMHD